MSLALALKETIEEELNGLLKTRREQVATVLIEGFMDLRKNQVPGLPKRIEEFVARIHRLAQSMTFRFVGGAVVVKASDEGELTLRLLKAGGQWFTPMPDVNDRIMRGLYA